MIKEFLDRNNIPYSVNTPLKTKTWIKTGGICNFYIQPQSIKQLEIITQFLFENKIKFEVVGATSNSFFTNQYNPQVVISTLHLNNITQTDNHIICECGVLVSKLARECVQKGIGGFSGLVNLPGTVAAAIYGNASCFGCSLSQLLESITILQFDEQNSQTHTHKLRYEDLKFEHRSSDLKKKIITGVIISIQLKKINSDPQIEIKKAENATRKRKLSQEKSLNNLGSVYGKLIYRKNIKNIIAYSIKRLFKTLHLANDGILIYKYIQLRQYGYLCLNKYISDKNINTFIWQDEKAEEMFQTYQEFMNKVYINPQLEIEIKK